MLAILFVLPIAWVAFLISLDDALAMGVQTPGPNRKQAVMLALFSWLPVDTAIGSRDRSFVKIPR